MQLTASSYFLSCILLFVSSFNYAASLQLNEPLPRLIVSDLGECILEEGKGVYLPWQSDSRLGKVQVIEYVPARVGVDKVYQSFYEGLESDGLLSESVAVTRVVNASDATWGTSGLVAGEVKKSKLKEPYFNFVVDSEGLGRERWGFKKKAVNLLILDREGQVVFTASQKMSDEALASSLNLMKTLVLDVK